MTKVTGALNTIVEVPSEQSESAQNTARTDDDLADKFSQDLGSVIGKHATL